MPRDGSQVYSQPEPNVAPSTTIESAVYNHFTNDVAADLNYPRPIIAGGTGETNARDAMIALGGEISVQVVTNYDADPIVPGSFYSAVGATSAPNSTYKFSGICHINVDNNNVTLEAREYIDAITLGKKYVRQKVAGTWQAWVVNDGMIPAAGGTPITGPVTITNATPSTTPTTGALVVTGGAGISGALNVGGAIGVGGAAAIGSTLVVGGNAIVGGGGAGATIQFGNLSSKYLNYDGTNFNFGGGGVVAPTISTGGITNTGNQSVAGNETVSGTLTVTGTITGTGSISGNSITTNNLTTNGTDIFYQTGGAIDGASGGPFMIQSTGQAMITMHNAGSFAGNLGFIGADLYMGGWSFGTGVKHRILSTKDGAIYAGIPPSGNPGTTNVAQNQMCIILDGGGTTINGAAHAVGTCITFYANGGSFAINNSETMFWRAPTGATTGNRTIADRGVATALKIAGGHWVISGSGLT
jgi:hypothetical protein